MGTKESIVCELLECGCLDLDYLDELCDKNNIDLDIQSIKQEY